MARDLSEQLQEQVRAAQAAGEPLQIIGGNSKHFLGRDPRGTPLAVGGHAGIIDYAPHELVLTARAGTPLADVDALLASHGQHLGFEPPHFGPQATLGGAIACGLSGPRRPYTGAARDFVLGLTCLTGTGDILRFGGRVMKNVAGYDVSRLMTGALGTLGVVLEVSLKLLPRPERELTLVQAADIETARSRLARWSAEPLPLAGAAYDGDRLWLRLSGSAAALDHAKVRIGGDSDMDGSSFWSDLREHTLPFFRSDLPLWRLSVAPAQAPLPVRGRWFYDWGGAQRWLLTDESAECVRAATAAVGGHATLFRGGDRTAPFHPPAPALMSLHKRLKDAFDPRGIMNPGRLYPDW